MLTKQSEVAIEIFDTTEIYLRAAENSLELKSIFVYYDYFVPSKHYQPLYSDGRDMLKYPAHHFVHVKSHFVHVKSRILKLIEALAFEQK